MDDDEPEVFAVLVWVDGDWVETLRSTDAEEVATACWKARDDGEYARMVSW